MNFNGHELMYKDEMEVLHRVIDEEKFTPTFRQNLHKLVDEFFSIDYTNISENQRRRVLLNFKSRVSSIKKPRVDLTNSRGREVIDHIENYLCVVLDRSVQKSRNSFLEKIIDKISKISLNLSLFKIR